MRKQKFLLDRKSLEITYFTFIRPLLEYADVVWDKCTFYEVNALQNIQLEAAAARKVTGATALVSWKCYIKKWVGKPLGLGVLTINCVFSIK